MEMGVMEPCLYISPLGVLGVFLFHYKITLFIHKIP